MFVYLGHLSVFLVKFVFLLINDLLFYYLISKIYIAHNNYV